MPHRPELDFRGSPSLPRRRRRSHDEISEILEELRASGLSQRAFCQTHKLSVSTLGSWIKKYRGSHPGMSEGNLIPVRITTATTKKSLPIEVVLANDRVVRVFGDFDPRVLSKLLSVAESPC